MCVYRPLVVVAIFFSCVFLCHTCTICYNWVMNIVCAPYVCVGKVFFLRKKFPLLQNCASRMATVHTLHVWNVVVLCNARTYVLGTQGFIHWFPALKGILPQMRKRDMVVTIGAAFVLWPNALIIRAKVVLCRAPEPEWLLCRSCQSLKG